MTETSRDDIRRILKTFGIQADETIMAHISQDLPVSKLRVRLTLTDLTEYGVNAPDKPLALEIEGSVSL
jgi:hypothetical protein